jgi:hypothetical protein
MTNSKVINFINFLYKDIEESNKIIEEELKETGFDTEKFQKKILGMIVTKERELRFEKGKKLKEIYEKLKDRIKNSELKIQEPTKEYNTAMAFRNLEEKLSEQEIDSILKDEMLLEELAKELEKNSE